MTPAPSHSPTTSALRVAHHLMAAYVAMGLRLEHVAELTGHSPAFVTQMLRAPAFGELVAWYEREAA